ncbi:outer membrane beta-barrel protein [Mesorhizobium yinganensis]|uniref:outer membrane beta-barrel protein n=1 Tax=Mesorhizobium yinganensis TaxID=3157707 RepID=UPI0032B753DD
MPQVRIKPTFSLRAKAASLLLASASLLAVSGLAAAQDAAGLRGAIQPGADSADPMITGATQAAADQAPPSPYVPVSPGAVPDEQPLDGSDPSGTLFPQDQGDDKTFIEDLPIPGTRPPSTARDRKQSREQQEQSEAAPRPNTRDTRSGVPAQDQGTETTGTVRTEPVGPAERIGVPDDAGRVEAIEVLDPTIPEQNPFAPVGIRVGTFILRPTIEQGITVTSNANYSVDGQGAVLSETTLRLNAVSDWSQHSATFDGYGVFRKSLSGFDLEDSRIGGIAALNLDISEELRARGTLEYLRVPETASSPVVIEGTVSDPIHQAFGGTLGLEKDVGKARFGITARVDRDVYGNADLSDGDTLSQKDRDATLVTGLLRAGYEISPAITPFVEVEGGRQFYDQTVDSAGYRRSNDRYGARAGVELDLNEKLTGEFSGGWLREKFDDDRLVPIDGPTLSALLTWSPERETTVNIEAATTVEGTTTAGESGSLLHAVQVGVERQARANLTTNAKLGLGYRNYADSDSHDFLYNAEVGATWWLNRYAGVTGRLRYEGQESNIEGRAYTAQSAFLGLKVQR